jgi:hypothetical protein
MSAQGQAISVEKSIPCIARQPILTAEENVIGYELFFREDSEKQRFTSDADAATSATIYMLNFVGLGVMCDGRLAFINSTRQILLSDYFALLPPQSVVIEIQEGVPADEEVIGGVSAAETGRVFDRSGQFRARRHARGSHSPCSLYQSRHHQGFTGR